VFETYRMLGQDREAELQREAQRLQRAALAPRGAGWRALRARISTSRRIPAAAGIEARPWAAARRSSEGMAGDTLISNPEDGQVSA
jgi:hypothetical protein